MFLSGADGSTPELRPPSIKGALRFWWRAMNGGDYKELKKREDDIFGSENKRSKLILKILEPFPNVTNNPLPDNEEYTIKTYFKEYRKNKYNKPQPTYNINILHYLAYGPIEKQQLKRGYINTSELFYLRLSYPEEFSRQIEQAFLALSRFGALGSRNRNGYGCFKISGFDKKFANQIDLESLKKEHPAKFTTFSKDMVYYQTEVKPTWHEALVDIGKKYQNARQNVEKWRGYNKRILLTQPITNTNKENATPILKEGRHSKPYFLHVEKIDKNEFKGKILCLPYEYLSDHPTFSEQYTQQYNQAIIEFNKKLGI